MGSLPINSAQEKICPNRPPPDTGHHFNLPSPNGPKTTGRCKLCGFEKKFESWENVEPFSRDKPMRRKGVGPRPVLSGRAW